MFAKLKTLIKAILQYLLDNPVQRTILVACGVAIVALIITLIVVGAVKRKKRKAQQAAAPCTNETATEEIATEEIAPAMQAETAQVAAEQPAEEQPAEEQATAPETTAEEQPAEEQPAETQAIVAAQPKKEKTAAKKAKPTSEKTTTAKKASETKKETQVTKKTEPKPTVKAAEKKAETTVKATPKKETPAKTAAKQPTPAKPATEKADTAQPSAKYTGKWVICQLSLTDSEGNVVEENYFFELRASNGERLLVSEEYTSHAGAIKGIQTHKDNVEKGNFRITLSKKGDYIFKLLTAKNTLLCTGANYKSLERCERAIASTKRFAATAVIQDEMEEIRMPLPAEEETAQAEVQVPDNGYTGKWIINTTGNEEVGIMYYFELFASNGEKLLTSEEYTTYEGAVNAVATHKANIAKGNFRISVTKKGDYLFKLLGGNGQLLCMGEHYKTRSRCESAVESVKRFSQSAPVYKYGEING